jgi:predicted dienelactone hydrolase
MNVITLLGALASLVLAIGLPVEAAMAAGIQALNVPAQGSSQPFSGAVWYPCAIAPSPTLVGPFVLSVTKDCPIDGTKLPLIVVSHGRTGSFMGHRDTAQALADAGFVVAAQGDGR